MLTLIMCLFLDFIYVQYKKKNIVNKPKKRWKIENHNKWGESQCIPFKLWRWR
jgi:hypothetical protein